MLKSSQKKFDCSICHFKTNSKKEFSDHISFPSHRDAAMKKLGENLK
jgi:hypothetical protein